MSIKVDLSDIKTGDIICSVWSRVQNKWIRTLKDKDNNDINIHKLEVERSLNGSVNWILCLYQLNSKDCKGKHIFYLDLDKFKFKIWKKI
jgi:hypothetical protein